MLVTFTTEASADITLFGEVALELLKMMGHSASVPGAILAADVPAALNNLTIAIDAGKTLAPMADQDTGESMVSMHNRALPLMSLLTAAAKADKNVMWK